MSDTKFKILIGGGVLLMLTALVGSIYLGYQDRGITREVITNAEIQIRNSDEGIKRQKLLFTENAVYEIEDRFFIGYFNSMDTFNIGRNNIGNTCDIESIGSRIGFLSTYKSVIAITNCETPSIEE